MPEAASVILRAAARRRRGCFLYMCVYIQSHHKVNSNLQEAALYGAAFFAVYLKYVLHMWDVV